MKEGKKEEEEEEEVAKEMWTGIKKRSLRTSRSGKTSSPGASASSKQLRRSYFIHRQLAYGTLEKVRRGRFFVRRATMS